MSPYVRTVKTASGARAVQIVHSSHRGSRDIEHIGSAYDAAELELLNAVARQRLQAGQGEFDLGLDQAGSPVRPGAALPITSTRMRHLTDALTCGFTALGLDVAAGRDEVFTALVLARIIEPTSKLDSLRVLDEAGIGAPSYPTVKRHLPAFATDAFREALSAVCADHAGVGPGVLVLYDVNTLYFETDTADEFRIPGFSKERHLEPQITIGLLVDGTGFPLMVQAFEGNTAETTTMLPTIDAFKAGGVPRLPLLAATLTSVVAGDNPAGEHRAIWFQELTGDLQTERVQPGERGQIRVRKSRVSHVEVFREDSVRTSIIGRPRPRSRLRRADLDYTLNCEEPLN